MRNLFYILEIQFKNIKNEFQIVKCPPWLAIDRRIFQGRMPFAVFIHGRWGYEGKDDGTASGSYALHTPTWRSTCSA